MEARLPHRRAVRRYQRPSHRGLLTRDVWAYKTAPIDAITIPAARHAHGLKKAVRLAVELDCPIVVLCSYGAHPADVTAIAAEAGAHAIAVDATNVQELAPLETTAMLEGTPFHRRTDTPIKRNLGLALARMVGWQHILLLDDDVTGVTAKEVSLAAGLLGDFDIVGMENDGFYDNSVVCHANRDTGGVQGTFIGAGGMLINSSRTSSFFPDIYNEDWFYLLDETGLARSAVYGTFSQTIFDPYADPARASSQEFGDCLAEGIYSLVDDERPPAAADRDFWKAYLTHRRFFIEEIRRRLARSRRPGFVSGPIDASLEAALASLADITPALCASFIEAWRRDRHDWSDWIEALPTPVTIAQALAGLGQKFEEYAPQSRHGVRIAGIERSLHGSDG
jgi:hypothetical protein